MAQHAILSPSGASRWLACTPSARLEEGFPDRSGEAAKEGTLAHSLGELIIRAKEQLITKPKYQVELASIKKNSLFEDNMFDYAEDYALFVLERFAEAQSRTKDAQLFLEQKLNLTDYVPEGFGTGDAIIIADGVLDIIDLKYGKGVPVTAEENKQMMLYSLGALKQFDFLYAIDSVRMTIYQPRLDSISTYEMTVTDLHHWAKTELVPKARLAFDGEGEFVPGKHCQFCKAKAVCKANADEQLQLAKYDFAKETLLKDEEISDILSRADAFKKWVTAVEEYALIEAVENNKKWPEFKLVEGRSNRIYSDETAVAKVLVEKGFEEDKLYTKKLLGITAMEKAITKAEFNTLLNPFIIKPPGKPTLVPVSDKRPEYNSVEGAIADFQNIEQ
jgi:hypothetical protein